jgi:hypothetical protein
MCSLSWCCTQCRLQHVLTELVLLCCNMCGMLRTRVLELYKLYPCEAVC